MAPGVAEVASGYVENFVSETHPTKPKSGDENKVGRPENQERKPRRRTTQRPLRGATLGDSQNEAALIQNLRSANDCKWSGRALTSRICATGANHFLAACRLEANRALNW